MTGCNNENSPLGSGVEPHHIVMQPDPSFIPRERRAFTVHCVSLPPSLTTRSSLNFKNTSLCGNFLSWTFPVSRPRNDWEKRLCDASGQFSVEFTGWDSPRSVIQSTYCGFFLTFSLYNLYKGASGEQHIIISSALWENVPGKCQWCQISVTFHGKRRENCMLHPLIPWTDIHACIHLNLDPICWSCSYLLIINPKYCQQSPWSIKDGEEGDPPPFHPSPDLWLSPRTLFTHAVCTAEREVQCRSH